MVGFLFLHKIQTNENTFKNIIHRLFTLDGYRSLLIKHRTPESTNRDGLRRNVHVFYTNAYIYLSQI